ncbi:dihydroneopterin aldolase [Methylocella sp. CPCC 101449]|uniref:dihydroneopterin aldolase n=1 Tax=Methylocella sp. CPCC 101449 TaxID=2987531 RepID=UPI0028926D24|nr:dihydroneopterin aldolase [Methylocella sp. CPCC 101449]MDT2019876.1 dihydroneopterin aldolase [Methylocella sp. CPCC 101449]
MSLPGKVIIEQLELHAYHGWHKHEKEFGQAFAIDIEFEVDMAIEAASDQLQDALDYDAIVNTVRRLFVESHYKLVEAAAAALASGLLDQFARVDAVHLRIRKLKPPIPERIGAVGVDLRMTRDQLKSR